jgi:ABC-type transport system involved in cytochrome bd biosynthesis fused ATPase/permease subunit
MDETSVEFGLKSTVAFQIHDIEWIFCSLQKSIMPEEKDKVMLENLAKVMDITEVNVAYEKMGGKQPDFTFSWEDINYSVEQGDELKQILTGVTGKCKSGELIAIMGGSGNILLTKVLVKHHC